MLVGKLEKLDKLDELLRKIESIKVKLIILFSRFICIFVGGRTKLGELWRISKFARE